MCGGALQRYCLYGRWCCTCVLEGKQAKAQHGKARQAVWHARSQCLVYRASYKVSGGSTTCLLEQAELLRPVVARCVEAHCSVIAFTAAGAVHVYLNASKPKRNTARRARPFGMLALNALFTVRPIRFWVARLPACLNK